MLHNLTKFNFNKISNKKFKGFPKWEHFNCWFESDSFITNERIRVCLDKFWDEHFKNVSKDEYINIIFKVYLLNFDGFRSISLKYRACKRDYNKTLEYCIESWNAKSEEYKNSLCSGIAFAYRKLPKEINISSSSFPRIKGVDDKVGFIFGGYDLPKTMDFTKWGKCHQINDYNFIVSRINSKATYNVVIHRDCNEIEFKVRGRLIVKFFDYKMDLDRLDFFKRVINNQEYLFKDGRIIFKTILRKCKFISNVKKSAYLSEKFITMDLETRKLSGVLKAYCVSLNDGSERVSFFLTDFKNSSHMLECAVKFLMKRKYDGCRVYLHNFSNFDSVFLINTLSKLTSGTLKPNRRNGKLIDVQFRFGRYSLYFRDSYLLLPSSLRKLAVAFNVENKGHFPHSFLDDGNVELDYVGKVPSLKYFCKFNFLSLSFSEWKEVVNIIRECSSYRQLFNNKVWNLREESIKYCEQDVITLYQVIDAFSKWIFKMYRVDVHKYPTLPSLAFAIYRSNFMGDAKIPIITGNMYNFFQKGYTGGSVDVYKPYGKNVRRYDVNSLYPYVMKEFAVPVNNPTYFEGDVLKFKEKPFGVFEVKVYAPKGIKIPLLQKRLKVNGNTSTISPLGVWKGVYFSEELYNAINFGYKIEVIRGFLFDKDFIFSKYVDSLYAIKEKSNKGSPEYLISKMLLNSLYGRFGMSPEIELHEIVADKRAFEIENRDDYIVTDITPLENDKTWISFISNAKDVDGSEDFVNVSVPIALAITAYARIHMSTFKTLNNATLYYMDTDSADLDRELDPKLVGKKLGQMKLEHVFKESVYLAPKVYGGIAEKGTDYDKERYEIVKAKGYKEKLSYKDVKSLLIKDSVLKLDQSKWYKNYTKSEISIKDEVYSLMVTTNKRSLIYNSEGVLIDTTPIVINEESCEQNCSNTQS